MPKIAVAGACGFLGSHIIENLMKNNTNELVGLVRSTSKRENLSNTSDVEFREVDFLHLGTLTKALEDVEIIINCIALLGDYDHLPRSEHYKVDAGILENLLNATNPKKLIQFIHVSTTGVYGGKKTADKLNENTPFGTKVSKYEWGKIEAEKVVIKEREHQRLPVTVARPAAIFGPRMIYGWPNIMNRLKSGTFRMIGDGLSKFHVTYVDDVAEGICLLAGNEKTIGEAYNVVGDEVPTINEYFSLIGKELGSPPIKSVPFAPVMMAAHLLRFVPKFAKPGDLSLISPGRVRFFKEHRIFDNSKIKNAVQFQPKVTIKEGIERAVKWYKENGYI
ncbi:NAD(P)-dependent oxidoreductase [candidate division KSB1 bacterium]|nr:NAD(P)-dependent oxidoreductase [candidate division KSB1 bacterium]